MKKSKRLLWEVRQRYGIDTPLPTSAKPESDPPASPPPSSPPASRRSHRSPKKKSPLKRILLLVITLLLAGGGVFGYKILAAGNKISIAERSILGQLKDLLFSSGQTLKGEKDEQINILLLAVGGEGHKGENLADTIMVASIRPQTHEVALLSIPRDLYVQVPGESYFSKINAVHSYGEAKNKDLGPQLLKQAVEDITGLPIHYFARADFLAFKHIVDAVGGVDITIENSFFDYWHKISFPAGTERMNGERALAYVRARYIDGPEGGDFRRAARQQHILLALREKVFSAYTAFDFARVNAILNSLADNVRTDMQLWEMRRFYELARTIDHSKVHSVVLSTGPNGLLIGSTEILGGTPASVLRTRTGDFSEIRALAQNIFASAATPTPASDPSISNTSATPTPTPEVTSSPKAETATIEIRNGTTVTGLASRVRDTLQAKDYQVATIGNAVQRDTAKTTVYALNLSQVNTAQNLAKLLKADSDSGLPKNEAKSSADILIIVGSDSDR